MGQRLGRHREAQMSTVQTKRVDAALAEQKSDTARTSPLQHGQAVELGDINYVNLTKDRKHGDFDLVMKAAHETGRPIFANFVEWSG